MAAKKKLKKRIVREKSEGKVYLVFDNCSENTIPFVSKWLKSVDLRIVEKAFLIPAGNVDAASLKKEIEDLDKLQVIGTLQDIEAGNKDHIIIYEAGKVFCTVDLPQIIAFIKKKPEKIWNISIKKNDWSAACSQIYIVPGTKYRLFTGEIKDFSLNHPKVARIVLKSVEDKYERINIRPVEIHERPGTRKSWINRKASYSRFLFLWYYMIPFKNIGEQFRKGRLTEPAIYRGIFVWFITLLLIVFPLLSRKAGISGDEDRHYRHAKLVYDYYATWGKDTAALNTPKTLLHYYGQSFDNITYILVKAFKIENYYEFRHFLNSLTGWVTVLFTGLLAALIARWRAAIMAALIMFLSPRFLGHALNNPVDIPFAMAGVFTMYYIVKLNMDYPRLSFKNLSLIAVGIAMAISIRIGGLIFIGFAGMFTGLNFLFKAFGKGYTRAQNKEYFYKLVGFIILASLAGYFMGELLWPYALQSPVKNPITALNKMTNIANALRQLFEGKLIWSDAVPWYYYLKYMLYTIPIIVFAGIIALIILLRKSISSFGFVNLFILFFSFVFPVAYIIYKGSNVYGGWRHLNFVYPTMVVFAVLGLEAVFLMIKNFKFQIIPGALILTLLYHPARHIIANYPHEYIYYNQIIGGIKGAYGEFETDYYFHSFREAAEWLKDNVIKNNYDSTHKVTVLANAGIAYHFKDVKDRVNVEYQRYYRRGEKDWDYGIFANSYISPYQMKHGIWPPKGTIHTIDIDGYPICAIVERKDKNDYYGTLEIEKGNYNKAIEYLNKAIQYDPNNEYVYVLLSQAYINTGQFDKAINAVNECMKTYPNYELALGNKALALLYKNDLRQCIETLNTALNENKKFTQAYYYKAYCYYRLQDYRNALMNVDMALRSNPNHKASYVLAAEIYKSIGNMDEYKRLMQIANSLP